MKKFLCLLTIMVICIVSACSPYGIDNRQAHKEIVDSDKYYCIYKDDEGTVGFELYNMYGDVVLSEKTNRPIKVNMLNEDIVHIEVGMGTGIAIHKFFNVSKNQFSQEFTYVLANSDNLIEFIDIPKNNSMENRKVVVQNVFDSSLYYKEFSLNFSNVDTPVVEANFTENETSLQLTYLSGREKKQTTTILDLT